MSDYTKSRKKLESESNAKIKQEEKELRSKVDS